MTVAADTIHRLWYHWRRNNWILYPPRLFRSYSHVRIDRPIFFVGNQGGGLTLVSRMIRRHPDAVSVSGGSDYWSGADEMQKVANLRLPPSLGLGGKWIGGGDPPHDLFTLPRGWSYASDDLFDWYHRTEEDYDEDAQRRLRRVIRESLHRFAQGRETVRFVDKSQVFTLKMRFVEALLRDDDPYFVLVTRNPYAAVYRAATKTRDMVRYSKYMSVDERVDICAQHWGNAMSCALEDGRRVKRFAWFRFEDVLRDPEGQIRSMCQFLDLEFTPRLIPHENDTMPLGSKYRDRWYPLRPEVNQQYFESVDRRHLEVIRDRCGTVAREFGYEYPE